MKIKLKYILLFILILCLLYILYDNCNIKKERFIIGIPRTQPDMNRVRGSSPDLQIPDLQIPDIDYLMEFSNWEGLNLSGLDFSLF